MSDSTKVFVRICDLQERDRVLSGAVMGSIMSVEDLTVKSVSEADNGKYAVTFFGLGTVFVHSSVIVAVAS